MSKFGLLLEAENIQYDQKCALTTLGIIQEKLEKELMSIEQAGALKAVGCLQDLADAIYIISTVLSKQNEKLREAVEEEYRNRKEGGE